jgi:hypothetical protein
MDRCSCGGAMRPDAKACSTCSRLRSDLWRAGQPIPTGVHVLEDPRRPTGPSHRLVVELPGPPPEDVMLALGLLAAGPFLIVLLVVLVIEGKLDILQVLLGLPVIGLFTAPGILHWLPMRLPPRIEVDGGRIVSSYPGFVWRYKVNIAVDSVASLETHLIRFDKEFGGLGGTETSWLTAKGIDGTLHYLLRGIRKPEFAICVEQLVGDAIQASRK